MRSHVLLFAAAALTASAAPALGQSSNTSSNSSSNNGITRERIVDTYCDNGRCTRYVERSVYRDRRHYRDYDRRRYRGDYYYRPRDRDDDD